MCPTATLSNMESITYDTAINRNNITLKMSYLRFRFKQYDIQTKQGEKSGWCGMTAVNAIIYFLFWVCILHFVFVSLVCLENMFLFSAFTTVCLLWDNLLLDDLNV